jgi:hypothetical protein
MHRPSSLPSILGSPQQVEGLLRPSPGAGRTLAAILVRRPAYRRNSGAIPPSHSSVGPKADNGSVFVPQPESGFVRAVHD